MGEIQGAIGGLTNSLFQAGAGLVGGAVRKQKVEEQVEDAIGNAPAKSKAVGEQAVKQIEKSYAAREEEGEARVNQDAINKQIGAMKAPGWSKKGRDLIHASQNIDNQYGPLDRQFKNGNDMLAQLKANKKQALDMNTQDTTARDEAQLDLAINPQSQRKLVNQMLMGRMKYFTELKEGTYKGGIK